LVSELTKEETTMFQDQTVRFQEQLDRIGVAIPAGDVENAISYGIDRLREREGFTTRPDMAYADYWWSLIEEDVIEYLHNDFGLEYDVFAQL
jgi:hypothetical protein